jgi:hypothetical protein
MEEKALVLENLELRNNDRHRRVCERNGEGRVENVDTSRSARVRTCPRRATPIIAQVRRSYLQETEAKSRGISRIRQPKEDLAHERSSNEEARGLPLRFSLELLT